MIDTLHLMPPDLGPRSNPVLYGVAEAIAELFPPVALTPRHAEDAYGEPCAVELADTPLEPVAAD